MKKNLLRFVAICLTIISLCALFTGCDFRGYDFVDTKYHYDRAIIKMPNGDVIDVQIEKWADSEDGEQLTITGTDGTVYLVSSVNCILIRDGN